MSTPPRINKKYHGFDDEDDEPKYINKKRSKTRRRVYAPPSNNRFKGVNEYGIPIPSRNAQNYEPGLNETVMLLDPSANVNIIKKARNNRNSAVANYKTQRNAAIAARGPLATRHRGGKRKTKRTRQTRRTKRTRKTRRHRLHR